jgi:hypothetical protein
MNIQLVNKLKDSVNFFDDAEFVSLVSENQILVRNTSNGSEWLLSFAINEAGVVEYDGENAECITEAADDFSEETKYKKNVKSLMESITMIFEDKEKGIEQLSGLIKTLPMTAKPEVVTEEVAKTELKVFADYQAQVEEFNTIVEEFMANGKMFDEEGDVRYEKFFEAEAFKKAYEEKISKSEAFFENLVVYKEFCDEVKNSFDDEVAKIIIESIDFTTPKSKYKMLVSKNLVKFKQETQSEINVLDESTKAIELFENTLGQIESKSLITENEATDMTQSYYANRFTRFNVGLFKRQDLVKINEELTAAMTSFDIENPEDLAYINDLKMKIEYMERANQIDDELVCSILEDFNKKYAHDKAAWYRDDSRTGGFKSPNAQKVGALDVGAI